MFLLPQTSVRLQFDANSKLACLNNTLAKVVKNVYSVYHEDGNRVYEVKQQVEVFGAACYPLAEELNGQRVFELDSKNFTVVGTSFVTEDVQLALVTASIKRLDPNAKVIELYSQVDAFNTHAKVALDNEYFNDDGSLYISDKAAINTIHAVIETDLNPEGVDGFSTGNDTLECPEYDLLEGNELPRGERTKRTIMLSRHDNGISNVGLNGWTIDSIGLYVDNIDAFLNKEERLARLKELNAPEIIVLHETIQLEIIRNRLVAKDITELHNRREERAQQLKQK